MGGISDEVRQRLGQAQQGMPQQAPQVRPQVFPQFQPSSAPELGYGNQINPGPQRGMDMQQVFNLAQGLQQGLPQQQSQYQPIGQPQIIPPLGQNAVMGGVQGGYNPQPQQQGLGGLQINKWASRLGQR